MAFTPKTWSDGPAGGTPVTAAELNRIEAGISAAGRACSTDGTNGLPAPTGVGLEFVITAAGLQDIRFNGTSL